MKYHCHLVISTCLTNIHTLSGCASSSDMTRMEINTGLPLRREVTVQVPTRKRPPLEKNAQQATPGRPWTAALFGSPKRFFQH